MLSKPAIAYLAAPESAAPTVLVLHSWWGMTDSFTHYADQLAARGFLAGCVDLYSGQIATSQEEVRALRSASRRESLSRTMGRAVVELRDHPLTRGNRMGLVGFSMGGHWAVWLAQRPEVHAGAVVLYYAARAVTRGAPVPVLAHFAESDPYVSDSGRSTMRVP